MKKSRFTNEKSLSRDMRFVSMIGVVFIFLACQSVPPPQQPLPMTGKPTRILILPFKNAAAVYGEDTHIRCPVCGTIYKSGPVPLDAGQLLTEHLTAHFQSAENVTLIPADAAVMIESDLVSKSNSRITDRDLAIAIGHDLKADGVLTGYIYRFTELVGRSYGAESPASVAFDLHYLTIPEGRILWSATFDETQQSLSENLLKINDFIKRGGGWSSAGEMAILGLEKMMTSFPKDREPAPEP